MGYMYKYMISNMLCETQIVINMEMEITLNYYCLQRQ